MSKVSRLLLGRVLKHTCQLSLFAINFLKKHFLQQKVRAAMYVQGPEKILLIVQESSKIEAKESISFKIAQRLSTCIHFNFYFFN
jgi:hypothetical protein